MNQPIKITCILALSLLINFRINASETSYNNCVDTNICSEQNNFMELISINNNIENSSDSSDSESDFEFEFDKKSLNILNLNKKLDIIIYKKSKETTPYIPKHLFDNYNDDNNPYFEINDKQYRKNKRIRDLFKKKYSRKKNKQKKNSEYYKRPARSRWSRQLKPNPFNPDYNILNTTSTKNKETKNTYKKNNFRNN